MGFSDRVIRFAGCSRMMSVSGASLINTSFCGSNLSKIHYLVHPAFVGNVQWFKRFFEEIVEVQSSAHLILETSSNGDNLTFNEFMSLPFTIKPEELKRIA